MLRHAFKEWAVICRALALGRQSIILRKGGIADEGGLFRPEHDRFLLYPTYLHQQQHDGIKPTALPLLEDAISEQPPAEILRIQHVVDVESIERLAMLGQALELDAEHIWSSETVIKRFHYREPGLWCLRVRVRALPTAIELPVQPEYDGCRTWVELAEAIDVTESR